MWTKEWPTKPGRYWFYGWPRKSMGGDAALYLALAVYTDWGQLLYIINDRLREEPSADGYWMPVEMPALPKEANQ